jgi:hypothetical protein
MPGNGAGMSKYAATVHFLEASHVGEPTFDVQCTSFVGRTNMEV